jgi:regulator of protease activity HflC (stomatin/prohibitin superfamily)
LRSPSVRGPATTARVGCAALDKKLADEGVIIDAVSVQEVRYPKDATQRFSDAQAARTEVEKAKTEQDKAEVQAETAVAPVMFLLAFCD